MGHTVTVHAIEIAGGTAGKAVVFSGLTVILEGLLRPTAGRVEVLDQLHLFRRLAT